MDDKIKCTKDYSIFKFHKEQREPKPESVIKIINSMKKRGFVASKPIEINEDFEIIDGQTRFKAAKALGLCVYYVFTQVHDIESVREMAKASNKWDFEDYCTSFIRQGKEAYIELAEWRKKADLTWSKLFRTGILYNPGAEMREMRKSLYDGTISISEYGRKRIADFIAHYKDIQPIAPKVTAQIDFIGALAFLIAHPDYNPKKMMKKMEYLSRRLVKCADTKEYVEMLSEIYNYNAHAENIVDFNYKPQRVRSR